MKALPRHAALIPLCPACGEALPPWGGPCTACASPGPADAWPDTGPDSPPAAPALPAEGPASEASRRARRAAVRQDRLSATPPPVLADVLLMHADAQGRRALRQQLEAYGFRVHPVATLAQALVLAASHPYAAVLAALPPQAIDGDVQALFEHVQRQGRAQGVPSPACVLLAPRWLPMDRVRAELAGCTAALTLPTGARDIARVLDEHGIALPQDPRRG